MPFVYFDSMELFLRMMYTRIAVEPVEAKYHSPQDFVFGYLLHQEGSLGIRNSWKTEKMEDE